MTCEMEKRRDTYSGVLGENVHRHQPVDGGASRDGAWGVEAGVCINARPGNFHSANASRGIDGQGVSGGTWLWWTQGKTDGGRSGNGVGGGKLVMGCTWSGGFEAPMQELPLSLQQRVNSLFTVLLHYWPPVFRFILKQCITHKTLTPTSPITWNRSQCYGFALIPELHAHIMKLVVNVILEQEIAYTIKVLKNTCGTTSARMQN